MTTITYLHFCEDHAHREFLTALLSKVTELNQPEISFTLHPEEYRCGFTRAKFNNAQIRNTYQNVIIRAFKDYNPDLFFVGLDSEQQSDDMARQVVEILNQGVPPMYRPKTVIYLAVQNVEYWLLYLKLNAEGKRPKAFSLENRPRREVKQEVYGEGRPQPKRQGQVIADLTQQLDIDFLTQYSRSFNQAFMALKAGIDAVEASLRIAKTIL